jgi:phospholipase C
VSNPHNYAAIVNGTVVDNPPSLPPDQTVPVDLSLTWTTMAEELSQHGISWKWYTGAYKPTAANLWDVLPAFSYFQQHPQLVTQNVVGTQNFINSVKNGTLPLVSWIIPGRNWAPQSYPFTANPQIPNCATSEHPPARPDCGMDYVSYLIDSVMKSPYWASTAIVVTWDDYGGFYDHVAPPQEDASGEGFRVPTLIISPYAKHGYVDHTPYEFGSMLSLIESDFGLPSLGARDAVGIGRYAMTNSFDFNQSPQPPLIEPGNFTGPANLPPLSNGYPQYNPGSASSTSSSASSGPASLNPTQYYYIGGVAVATVAVLGSALYIVRRRRQ